MDRIATYGNGVAVFPRTYGPGLEGYDTGALVVTGVLDASQSLNEPSAAGSNTTCSWLKLKPGGETQIFVEAGGNTAEPALAGVYVDWLVYEEPKVYRLEGIGLNKDRDGYVRTMRVEINQRVFEVIPWLENGEELSFSIELPKNLFHLGFNRIKAYIHWGNEEYDVGHRISVSVLVDPPKDDGGAM